MSCQGSVDSLNARVKEEARTVFLEWHTRAAEKGFLLSQLELAQIHYYGSYRPSRRVFGEDAPPSLERAAQY